MSDFTTMLGSKRDFCLFFLFGSLCCLDCPVDAKPLSDTSQREKAVQASFNSKSKTTKKSSKYLTNKNVVSNRLKHKDKSQRTGKNLTTESKWKTVVATEDIATSSKKNERKLYRYSNHLWTDDRAYGYPGDY